MPNQTKPTKQNLLNIPNKTKNMQNMKNVQYMQNLQNIQNMQNLQTMQNMQCMNNLQTMQNIQSQTCQTKPTKPTLMNWTNRFGFVSNEFQYFWKLDLQVNSDCVMWKRLLCLMRGCNFDLVQEVIAWIRSVFGIFLEWPKRRKAAAMKILEVSKILWDAKTYFRWLLSNAVLA